MKHYAEMARDRVARLFGVEPKEAGDGVKPQHEANKHSDKEGKSDERKR